MGAPGAEFVIMASETESYFTTSFSFANIFVLTTDGQHVESPAGFSVYASSNTTFRVTASADAEYLLLFMDANGGLPAVAYYSYAAPAGPEQPEQPTGPISFVYPNEVQGATLEKANYETFPSAVSNVGIQMANTYVLTYTTQNPEKATLNVPGNPRWNSAYDNLTADPAYWLTHSMVTATTMDVYMKEADKVDFFVFNDTYALVCKYVPGEEGGSQGGDVVIPEPTHNCTLMMTYPNCSLTPLIEDSSKKDIAQKLYQKYNTSNLYYLNMNGSYDAGVTFEHHSHSMSVPVDMDGNSISMTIMGAAMNFLIQKPSTNNFEALVLLQDANANVLGVIYYTHKF